MNRQTRQWGTEYDRILDLGRVPLRSRVLPETIQSLAITLEPDIPQPEGEVPHGTLRIAWGELEYSVGWRVVWP